jgi:hypothetical protein
MERHSYLLIQHLKFNIQHYFFAVSRPRSAVLVPILDSCLLILVSFSVTFPFLLRLYY